MGTSRRTYLTSHPWITFTIDLRTLSHKTWMLLGEAESKCEHVAGVALRPETATRLYEIYLSKGVHGTTSIEGNTLSEDDVLQRIAGSLPLPPSRAYLGQEVDNVLAACNDMIGDLANRRPLALTRERLERYNAQVLDSLELPDGVVPGKVRTHSVGVMQYRGAPAEDCEYLLERLCSWLNQLRMEDDAMTFPLAILKAILAHLYIAWIHPFGDGNGRTARLIEVQLLIQAGVPLPCAHLLSDFYNKTRDAYYRELSTTSKPPYCVEDFVHYAVQGFVDELREQLNVIRNEQLQVTWENFVHEFFRDADSPAKRRQKHIVLDLTGRGEPWPVSRLPGLSPRVALGYHGMSDKTISRDVNELLALGLVLRTPDGLVPNVSLIRAFLPPRAPS